MHQQHLRFPPRHRRPFANRDARRATLAQGLACRVDCLRVRVGLRAPAACAVVVALVLLCTFRLSQPGFRWTSRRTWCSPSPAPPQTAPEDLNPGDLASDTYHRCRLPSAVRTHRRIKTRERHDAGIAAPPPPQCVPEQIAIAGRAGAIAGCVFSSFSRRLFCCRGRALAAPGHAG